MRPDELAEAVRQLRDLTRDVPTTATSEELWESAWQLAQDLDEEAVRVAAACYLLRVLKDTHREGVMAVERKATKRRLDRLSRDDMTPAERARHDANLRDQEESNAQFTRQLRSLISDYSDRLKMRWTEELLESTFALPDGTLVTWGEATLDDHEVRHAMLLTNAKGSLEAAARHQAAISELQASRRTCLRDLVAAA